MEPCLRLDEDSRKTENTVGYKLNPNGVDVVTFIILNGHGDGMGYQRTVHKILIGFTTTSNSRVSENPNKYAENPSRTNLVYGMKI